jgi:hypothetical protein
MSEQRMQSAPSSDGLDDDAWRRITAILSAAYGGDGAEFAGLLHAYDAAMSDAQRYAAGADVAYVLRFQVIQRLRRRPSADDLTRIAAQVYPRYAAIMRGPVTALENTLRAVFLLPQGEESLAGARLFISAAAAAGVLLDDPVADLASMRPRVAKWRARNVGAPGRI